MIFPDDEILDSPHNFRPANIGIVDDNIDEADEQRLIAYLQVVDAINPDLIDTTRRNISILTIIDNDSKLPFTTFIS